MKKILTGFAQETFKDKYAAIITEEWYDRAKIIADHAARAETGPDLQDQWSKKYYSVLDPQDFLPGGRIIYSAGKLRPMGSNCFGKDVEDSRESIGQLFADFMVISSSGGGVGINFSKLRPKGDAIKSIGGESSGAISWMHVINAMGDVIKAGGSRRMACLSALSVSHPEIEDFIEAKFGTHKRFNLNNMNISVLINNKFIEAVRNDEDFELVFRGTVYKTIKAKELWEKICKNAAECGEPGIQHEDNIRHYYNLEYFAPFCTSNPCSEAILSDNGVCCLGSINLSQCWKKDKDEKTILDVVKLKKLVRIGVRFLDNMIDVNHYPTKETEITAKMGRQIGLGVMGLHHLLIRLKYEYGTSEETISFLDFMYTTIRNEAYKTSIELAREKGCFQKFDPIRYLKNPYISKLPRSIKNNIKQYGIRNAAILTIAPTGTTSIIASTSSGIEPIPALVYNRKVLNNDDTTYTETIVVDPLIRELILEGKSLEEIIQIKTAFDISPEEHIGIQIACQDYIDNSISKTIVFPEDYNTNQISEIILNNIDDLKGISLYRNKSRENQPITPMKLTQELYNRIKEEGNAANNTISPVFGGCKDGLCDI